MPWNIPGLAALVLLGSVLIGPLVLLLTVLVLVWFLMLIVALLLRIRGARSSKWSSEDKEGCGSQEIWPAFYPWHGVSFGGIHHKVS
jgi:hypothetical protein